MPSLKLTKRSVANATCPVGHRKVTYSDTMTHGLVLEVRITGGKTYYLRYTDSHRGQRNIRIGDAKAVDITAARKRAIEMQSQRALGEDPANQPPPDAPTPTLREFVRDRFLPHVKGYKRSYACDKSMLNKNILPTFGDRPMDRIGRYEIVTLAQEKRESGLAAGTVNRMLVLFRHLYNVAIDWQVPGVAANPCQKIKLYPESGRERYLTEREVHTLMEAVRESQNVDLANIIAFLLLTGARKQEVLRAQWTDVDTVHRVWRIPVTKAGKPRYVPISDGLLRLLCCLTSRKRSIWVFPNPKTGLPYVDVHRAWDNARCKAGLSEVRIHDLRHTFASYLVNKRRSLYEVQRILGHSDSKSTQRYAHLAHESLVDAANAAGLIYQNATTESEGAAAGSGGTAGGATKQASSFDPESLAGNSTADEASVDRTEASDAQAQSLTPV